MIHHEIKYVLDSALINKPLLNEICPADLLAFLHRPAQQLARLHLPFPSFAKARVQTSTLKTIELFATNCSLIFSARGCTGSTKKSYSGDPQISSPTTASRTYLSQISLETSLLENSLSNCQTYKAHPYLQTTGMKKNQTKLILN